MIFSVAVKYTVTLTIRESVAVRGPPLWTLLQGICEVS